MAASYLPYLPDQDFLLPPTMREWLPEAHLAYFISDTVDSLKELGDLFVQVVRLAREMGLVKMGTIAVDGTNIKANACRHRL